MRKIMSFILVITIILTMSVPAVSAVTSIELKDLLVNGKAHWAKVYIDKLIDKLIITGYPDGTFKPDNNVEVDSYIKMVISALGNNFENGKDYWASPYINKAIELKLIDSNEFNTYRRAITREEAAKLIVQALATLEELPSAEVINKYKSVVSDYAKISEKYKQHALTAYATGMITGDPKGNFKPTDNLSRAEAATVIMRLLDKSLRKPIPVQEEETTVLPELMRSDEEVWGQENIGTMTSMKEYEVKNGKLYFTHEPYYRDLLPKVKLNPNINQQVHDLVKVLISKDHFVDAFYSSESAPDIGGYRIPSSVVVSYSKSRAYAENDVTFFNYVILDDRPTSDGQQIRLLLNRLWWEEKEDGSLYRPSKEGWSVPFYAYKLKKSIIVVFGEKYSEEIYEYIHSIYIDERTNQSTSTSRNKTKTIGNVKIDFYNEAARLYFYFTIK
ncbi:MAG TPA: S-layer homology domain-containing protein [Patescibacteria group bacterium]|nr:S-layer homology domain-containing protein [Patescibacteria group bacterium]